MAGRGIWKGNIHFGTIDVAVMLHAAVKEERVRFHLLHKGDNTRLRQQMVCAFEGVPAPAEEQVRGFEIEEGRYILVEPADLTQTEPEGSRLIEVHEFVKSGEIDPIFLERAYYLEPEADAKGYRALALTLREMGVEGVCTWTMRKRTYLGVLKAGGRALRLHTLRYAHEVASAAALEPRTAALTDREIDAGVQLINQWTGPFEPRKFEDEHEAKLRDLIDRKARGEKVAILRPRRLTPTSPDKLLDALTASLKKAG